MAPVGICVPNIRFEIQVEARCKAANPCEGVRDFVPHAFFVAYSVIFSDFADFFRKVAEYSYDRFYPVYRAVNRLEHHLKIPESFWHVSSILAQARQGRERWLIDEFPCNADTSASLQTIGADIRIFVPYGFGKDDISSVAKCAKPRHQMRKAFSYLVVPFFAEGFEAFHRKLIKTKHKVVIREMGIIVHAINPAEIFLEFRNRHD